MTGKAMRRRDVITLLGGAAVAAPLAAHAQQPTMPVVGYLGVGSPEPDAHRLAAFRKGLSEAGFVEGRNVAIEYRWGYGDNDRLPELAAELVRRRVAVVVTPAGTAAALAAKAATTTIPIVFSMGGDPVESGLVASFNRPGGNITGISSQNVELAGKRLGLLHELIPKAARFAVLINPTHPFAERAIRDAQAAAAGIGRQIEVVTANTNREIDAAFVSLAQKRADALLVPPVAPFNGRRVQIVTLAAHHRLPAVYPWREALEAGGLMSYGSSNTEEFRQVGIYAGRVLKGEKPADLPVMQPTKFELVINLQTARVLGIEVPPTLLAIADEVIE
jgi:putative tryptophan/tyrosine transport system substrate-binding protein